MFEIEKGMCGKDNFVMLVSLLFFDVSDFSSDLVFLSDVVSDIFDNLEGFVI